MIVTMLSLGDGASLSAFDLNKLNDLVSISSAIQGLSDHAGSGSLDLGRLGSDPFNGDFGDGPIDALDTGSESLREELTDASGNPVVIEGLWALRLDSRDDFDKFNLVAGAAGPGLYNDPDWFDSMTLVLVGSGAGLALAFLGLSTLRMRRRRRSRLPSRRPSHRPHRISHRRAHRSR